MGSAGLRWGETETGVHLRRVDDRVRFPRRFPLPLWTRFLVLSPAVCGTVWCYGESWCPRWVGGPDVGHACVARWVLSCRVCLGIATTFYFLTVIGTHDICCLGVQVRETQTHRHTDADTRHRHRHTDTDTYTDTQTHRHRHTDADADAQT
eukprot:2297402-Rhodomonas_salina.3